jgi:hypothetical protein
LVLIFNSKWTTNERVNRFLNLLLKFLIVWAWIFSEIQWCSYLLIVQIDVLLNEKHYNLNCMDHKFLLLNKLNNIIFTWQHFKINRLYFAHDLIQRFDQSIMRLSYFEQVHFKQLVYILYHLVQQSLSHRIFLLLYNSFIFNELDWCKLV